MIRHKHQALIDIIANECFNIRMSKKDINDAVKCFSNKIGLCRSIGMTPQFLTQILQGKRPIPPRYAVLIEQATKGAVTAKDLRPDVFDPSAECG